MSLPGKIEQAVAVVAAMLFGIAIAVIIMSIKRLRRHVSTGNSNDGLHQNSGPPANHAVEIPRETDSTALLPSWLGSHPPTRTNEETGRYVLREEQPANHPIQITQPRAASNQQQLRNAVSLNSYLTEHQGSSNGGSGLGSIANYFPQQLFVLREDTAGNVPLEEQPGNHPLQNTQLTPMWAFVNRRQLRNTVSFNSYPYEHQSPRIISSRLDDPLIVAANNAFLPATPVYLMPIRGGPYNGESNREPLPMDEPHSIDVFPVPPSPTPKTRPGPTRESSSKSLRDFSGTIFEYEELERATNGFSQKDNFLGSGAFGSVYRGVLSNGTEIAVKRLRPDSQRAEQEFQAEVDTISHIRYKHLVSMIGCCLHGDERLLVYEFVPNNTLHFHLHVNKEQTMDWPTRVKIAEGAAKGLIYLHETCRPRIIHRDIKACNILIDSEFNAKVADFGLAKLFPGSFTHISTHLAGTFGYMDPEYYGSGQLTEKSDVYSYGIMLLELITGRKPRGLALWAKGESPDEEHDYESLVDPQLQGNFNAEEMVRMVACAAACTRRYRRLRPSMSQVVRILNGEGSPVELNRSINQFVDNSIGQYDGDLKKFWKNAFLSPNNTTVNGSGLSVNSTY